MSTNERAQEALADLLNMAVDSLEGAQTFAEAQLPDVIEQLLMWKMLESLVVSLMSLGFVAIAIGIPVYTAVRTYRTRQSQGTDHTTHYVVNLWWDKYAPSMVSVNLMAGGGTVAMIAIFVASFNMNLVWLQIMVAPKFYLLEYAADLMK